MNPNVFQSEHRFVTAEPNYVLSISKGVVSNEEAVQAANAIIEYMNHHDYDKALFDLTEMKWIHDLSDRQLRFELVSISRTIILRMAFVSSSHAMRAMVADLLKLAGVKELSVFSDRRTALNWLMQSN